MINPDQHLPYERQASARRAGYVQHAATGLGAAYLSGATLMAQVPEILDQYSGSVVEHSGTLRIASGAAGVFFGVRGLRELLDAPHSESDSQKTWRRVRAGADLVTAVGLASQAFGAGTWAAGLSAAGLLTSTVLQIAKSHEEVK